MAFSRLHFIPMQSNEMYSSLVYTDAQVAVAQYKQGQSFWFDRVPNVGESVALPLPQQQGYVFFRVEQIEHRLMEPESANLQTLLLSSNSWVLLAPIAQQLS